MAAPEGKSWCTPIVSMRPVNVTNCRMFVWIGVQPSHHVNTIKYKPPVCGKAPSRGYIPFGSVTAAGVGRTLQVYLKGPVRSLREYCLKFREVYGYICLGSLVNDLPAGVGADLYEAPPHKLKKNSISK